MLPVLTTKGNQIMPVLFNSKHERFAQNVTKGLSATKAYISAGYSKAGAKQNASRLMAKDDVLARIKELQTVITERVVTCEVRRRSWRVQMLQQSLERMLALREARAAMYAGEMEGSHEIQVQTKAEERAAIAMGCRVLPVDVAPTPAPPSDGKDSVQPALPSPPEYPKTMLHPGYSVGGATGLVIKQFRGKKVIWTFDAALEAKIADCLKQAAIEEGQWGEKSRTTKADDAAIIIANLHAGRQRVADAKAKALANGEPWPE